MRDFSTIAQVSARTWFNNSGKVKVMQIARVYFSIGSYNDYADFDVVPIQHVHFC